MSSPVHIDPVDTYMTQFFWDHETVEDIIYHFIKLGVKLCDVIDLAHLSDDMIESARADLKLSYGETSMLKRLRDAQQSTPGPELASQSLGALLTRLRDI
jgi:hypothetical protein